MPEAGTDRQVYEGRINAVMDYVENHLDDELSLEQLAQVAHFSPFHFHRIFGAVTGETIGAFVARVRLERAATLLSASLAVHQDDAGDDERGAHLKAAPIPTARRRPRATIEP